MPDHIPLIDPVVGDEELENVHEVLESGYMTQGPFSERFENRFAEFAGSDRAVTATSCTTGMELALEALGVGEDDDVIVPDFTHPATANAVVRVGAEPILVDVDRETYTIDPTATANAVTDDTAAILPVSWGGQPLDPKPFRDIQTDHDLALLEDAACAAGASFDGQPVGSQFDISVFSFHPRKVLTTGEGGVVTTDDPELEAAMRRTKNFGTDPATDVGFVQADATNYRFSDVLAAIGVAQLEKRESIVSTRRALARRYNDLIDPVTGIETPTEREDGRHTYQSYCVDVEAGDDRMRDRCIEMLAESDIESQIGTYALHRTEAFEDAERVGSLEVSAALHDNLLTLPVAHTMTAADQERVVDTLTAAIE